MNPNTFDLDIDNYEIEDLQHFFNLKNNFLENDVIEASKHMKIKLSSHYDTNFRDKIYIFIKEAESLLLEHMKKSKIIPASSTYIIDNGKPSVTNNVTQVYPTQVANGVINPLKKKTITNTFAINTMFRDFDSKFATDCLINLPYTIKDVISMKVVSFELPQVIYLVNPGSNFIDFYEQTTNIEGRVIFPEGNYNYTSLSTMMTTEINLQLGTGNRFSVSIDPVTFKTTISNSTYDFNMILSNQLSMFTNYKTIGWILGFRNPNLYINKKTYTSESLFNPCPTDYLFLEVNDFNYSSASRLIGLFLDNFLDKNIIAKLPYKNCGCSLPSLDKCTTIFLNEENIISSVRNYFGPIHLQKLAIRLLNQFGEIVDLHHRDFSFTLEMEVLYDL
jgi:hypothetical protein